MLVRSILLVFCLLSAAPCFGALSLVDPNLRVAEVASGLSFPTTMAFIGVDDILVLQKEDGRVRRVINGVVQAGEVLDVAVASSVENGLLGIAIHPNFPTTPWIYLSYTESSTGSDGGASLGNRIVRYVWDGSFFTSPTIIASFSPSPFGVHNGGVMTFGPDGKLYMVIGDLTRSGQLQNVSTGGSPDDTSVIVRLNDDVAGGQSVRWAGGRATGNLVIWSSQRAGL